MTRLGIRDTIHRTAINRRHLSLSNDERVYVARLRTLYNQIGEAEERYELPPDMVQFREHVRELYLQIVVTAEVPDRVRRRPTFLCIDQVPLVDTYPRYLFKRQDLHRLHKCLRLDEFPVITLKNGCKFGSEELLLLGIHRLISPIRFTDLVPFYGRDWSAISRAFNWFMKYVRTRFYWRMSNGGIIYPEGGMCVFGFIDDTVIHTTRVGGGPAEPGEDAARFNPIIQHSFYTGYKHMHGLKYQSIELPNGLCMDLYGPTPVNFGDTELVTESQLEMKLAQLSHGLGKEYIIYGDGIFQHTPHIKSKHAGETTRAERYENGIMTKLRISNEWAYGITGQTFSTLLWKYALKLQQNRE
eukprot:CAMPEP_0173202072 /NCGR_PEP_ID=MMETSP1141-20130122/18734_1 /TAXON_ID=483371 /ORGANISM="non described non described, Strain CCMP2298" /LENGTH=356 /DNA_ID=CAMNT_0014127325 /DNA_START=83 /DNA_END=1150 /DNA_ORIENTATION=+